MLLRSFLCLVLWMLAYSALADELSPSAADAKDLMVIAFPDWKGASKNAAEETSGGFVTRTFHTPIEDHKASWPWLAPGGVNAKVGTLLPFEVRPLQVVSLDPAHVVLITLGAVDAEKAEMRCNYSCLISIGTYFFTSSDHGWRVSKRVDVAAAAYASVSPTEAKIENWPGHGRVLSILIGNQAQGRSTHDVILLGLQPDRLLPMLGTSIGEDDGGEGVGELTDEDGNVLSCGDALDPKFVLPEGAEFDGDCRSSDGSWKFVGDSVEFEFHGTTRKATGGETLPPLQHWKSGAILTLQKDGSLKLVKGTLPSYGI